MRSSTTRILLTRDNLARYTAQLSEDVDYDFEVHYLTDWSEDNVAQVVEQESLMSSKKSGAETLPLGLLSVLAAAQYMQEQTSILRPRLVEFTPPQPG